MGLKRTEKEKVTIGNYDFYINKFGAFKASNLSGELVRLFAPIIASAAPAMIKMLGDNSGDNSENNENMLDKEIDDIAPALAGAFDKLTGKQLEAILWKLLIEEKNISFVEKDCMDPNKVKVMEWDDADELFCGELQDMYQLAIKVIQLNYKGFFTKLAARYGLDLEKAGAAMLASRNMVPLMSASSAN